MNDYNFRAVIFDLDGLLIDSDELIYHAIARYLYDEFRVSLTHEQFGKLYGTPAKYFSDQIASLAQTESSTSEIMNAIQNSIHYNQIKLKDGAKELLDYLKENKIPRIIVSNSTKTMFVERTDHLKLDRWFDESDVVTVEMVKAPKPEPDIYEEAAKKLKLLPMECLALEDSETGLTSAQRAGCTAFFVPNPYVSDSSSIAKKLKVKKYNDLAAVLKQMP